MAAAALPLFYAAAHRQHDPASHPDVPGRSEELRQAALDFGAQEQEPGDFGMEPIAAGHSSALLALLQTA